ncbi:PREDICTED: cilia- and flagella-associated protein 52-like isoform X1 [Poecilia mexicana]|uniref:cilia- and flagella-associated protein 52-like isoform X1 n=1 Tax=Poecilia mexicana TaxID=48701 RepID=UPI00072E235D|nr:PREDICTED: cilia- and flagella-associated protein 52-like isoform X1 [Poecilia mexicana]
MDAKDDEARSIPELELQAVIGFNGHVPFGLKLHPDKKYLIYPLGSLLILKRTDDGKQEFLHGHSNNVSCVSLSKSGVYIASGQANVVAVKAPVIIWNYAARAIHCQLLLHKVKVEAVAFSPNDKHLVSLGGQDDGSIVVWNVETKQAICKSSASTYGYCLTVEFFHTSDNIFASAGSGTLRIWELDLTNRRIWPTDCRTGKLKRTVKCLEISVCDQYMFCGTTSGDVMKINTRLKLLNNCGPARAKFSGGINVLKVLNSGDMIIGTGSGTLALCSKNNFQTVREIELENGVTSVAFSDEGGQLLVGTEGAQMYRVSFEDFKADLLCTGHRSTIHDIAIPFAMSQVFATCSEEEIRLWRVNKPKELMRLSVPNVTCNTLCFMSDGHGIISGWSDGKIRMFDPKNGKPLLIMNNAHNMGVTTIANSRDSKKIVSGGREGQVRVWELQPQGHRLLNTLAEHKEAVTCVKIKSDDSECVTASTDGTCIIWDLVRFVSLQRVIANTLFRSVCYNLDEHQIITSGTDRKVLSDPKDPLQGDVTRITYWYVLDGSSIRELEGSQSGAINTMHITTDGNHFVTGGEDKQLKVWDYTLGDVTHVGMPLGASITSTKICSSNSVLVCTTADGGIWQWKFPHPPSS